MKNKHPLYYISNFIEDSNRDLLFDHILNTFDLKTDKYNFNGKIVESPRLIGFAADENISYNYSNNDHRSQKYSIPMEGIARKIEERLGLSKGYFNGCLINYYRNGHDSISYHKDNEPDMDRNTYIAVISLGAERIFYLKHDTDNIVKKIKLENGSLAIMTPLCQKEYKHAILKEKNIEEPRISLTFRHFINT